VIVVDSSVWIDYFRGTSTRESDKLDSLLGTEQVAIGDLILTEVLQGFSTERDFNQAKSLLTSLEVVPLSIPSSQPAALKATMPCYSVTGISNLSSGALDCGLHSWLPEKPVQAPCLHACPG
jgi:hypothetical protein